MKKIVISIGLTIIGAFAVLPRGEPIEYVHHPKVNTQMIKVEITGPYPYPGVYHFFDPLTVREALKYAGDPLTEIDDTHLNYSEIITKSRTITVKSIEDIDHTPQKKVNINKASFKELIEIPYMTETRAASLIIYREMHGAFMSIDDLVHVKHIGVVTLENLRPYITLS